MQDFTAKLLPLPVLSQAWETKNTRKKGEINESLKLLKQLSFGLTEEMVKASKCGFYWQIKVFFFFNLFFLRGKACESRCGCIFHYFLVNGNFRKC